jgi:ribosomal protein L11 methyltransferase
VIRLAVRVADSAHAEIVLAELLELAPGGVEEVTLDDGRVEYAVYGSPGELPEIADVRAAAGGIQIEVSSSEVAEDWSERWKRFHRPILIVSPAPDSVPSLYVRPPWESPAPVGETGTTGEAVEIAIDPGRAFGTGAHATTKLCLELVLALAADGPSRGALLDVGSGSGVLAIAAAKLGYGLVIALDHDPESLRASAENADVNGVNLDVRRLDVRSETVPWPATAPDEQVTIVANLLCPLLLDLTAALPAAPAHLLASGLLTNEVDEIVSVYERAWGMTERERRRDGEWAAVWLQAGSGSSVAARTIAR